MRRNECFNWLLASVSLLSRGWIVPVGGSTPDRLQDRPAQGWPGNAAQMRLKGGRGNVAQMRIKDERRNSGQG